MHRLSGLFLVLGCFAFGGWVSAQEAVEGVIVDRVAVTSARDLGVQVDNGDTLFTTYRVYIDLAPEFKMQAVFGNEQHPLILGATGMTYNTPVRGVATGNFIDPRKLLNDNLIRDSFITIAAVSNWYCGIPLERDIDGNQVCDGLPRETSSWCALEKDGLAEFKPIDVELVFVEFEGLGKESGSFSLYSTNGAWASRMGATGADEENTVLVAQITTNGELYFSLNLQLAHQEGGTVQHVATNAKPNQYLTPALNYNMHLFPN